MNFIKQDIGAVCDTVECGERADYLVVTESSSIAIGRWCIYHVDLATKIIESATSVPDARTDLVVADLLPRSTVL